MELKPGQLLVILAPFIDHEIYANIKIVNDDTLTITTKTSPSSLKGKEILCMVVDNAEIHEFYGEIEDLYENTIVISNPKSRGDIYFEQRRFTRVDCNINFMGKPAAINGIPIPNFNKMFTGTVLNLSAGGMLTETKLSLPENLIFTMKLKIDYFVELEARVVRNVSESESGMYETGCQFTNMTLDKVKTLSFYVFKEQLKIRKRELNNSIIKGVK